MRFWACCTLGVSAWLWSCGGRATDGVEADPSDPNASVPNDDESSFVRPDRETCDDNPLFAWCPYASGGSPTPPPEMQDAPPAEENAYFIVVAAQNILSVHCDACHGPTLTRDQASAGINYITDWDRLIRANLIEECSPERSRIVEVMRTGEMPPPNAGVSRVFEADIQIVESAIESGCVDE